MATIKIEHTTLLTAAKKANSKVTSYQNKIISSVVTFSSLSDDLTGKGYDSMLEQMTKKINSQKKLLAECQILADEIATYSTEMSWAESGTVFPQ